jgi:two-component system, OmpR family, response regulator
VTTPGQARTDADPGDTSRPERAELRVLLVEDSDRLRSRLRRLLDVPGLMRVEGEAVTEDAAIAELHSRRFDVLIVDVELSAGSGIGVIQHVRRESPAAGTAPLIIVLTNFALPTVRSKCMHAGADHFLDKMRQFEELRPLIEQWHRSNGARG